MVKVKGRPITCKVCRHKFRLKTKIGRVRWENAGSLCPACVIKYCNLQKTERDLRTFQDHYFNTGRNEMYMTQIYRWLYMYAGSLLLKLHPNMVETPQDLEFHSHNSATLLVEEYYKKRCRKCKKSSKDCIKNTDKYCKCEKPDFYEFRITASFGGFLVQKIKQSLWGKEQYNAGNFRVNPTKKGEKATYNIAVSIDEPGDDENNVMQLEDSLYGLEGILEDSNTIFVRDHVVSILFSSEIEKACEDKHENLIRILNLKNFLIKGESQTDKFFKDETFGRKGKLMFEKTIEILREVLLKLGQH